MESCCCKIGLKEDNNWIHVLELESVSFNKILMGEVEANISPVQFHASFLPGSV